MTSRPKVRSRTRKQIKAVIEEALRAEFPNDTVDVSDGFGNNIHVVVVSRRFDGLSTNDRLDILWSLIDRSNLRPEERTSVSLLHPLSPADIK